MITVKLLDCCSTSKYVIHWSNDHCVKWGIPYIPWYIYTWICFTSFCWYYIMSTWRTHAVNWPIFFTDTGAVILSPVPVKQLWWAWVKASNGQPQQNTTKCELWVYISWDIFVLYIHDWFAILSCKPCINNRCHVPCIAVCIADQVVIITSYMYPTDQRYWSMLIKASSWLYFLKFSYTLLNTACHLIAGMAFERASVTWRGWEGTRIVVPTMTTRGRLNIKMSSYQYRDPHVKDKTVSRPSYL